jgi:hypothetical protein
MALIYGKPISQCLAKGNNRDITGDSPKWRKKGDLIQNMHSRAQYVSNSAA